MKVTNTMAHPRTVVNRAIAGTSLAPASVACDWEEATLPHDEDKELFRALLEFKHFNDNSPAQELVDHIFKYGRREYGKELIGVNEAEPSCTKHAHEWATLNHNTHQCKHCGINRVKLSVNLYTLPTTEQL